jgi:hypothetical protein
MNENKVDFKTYQSNLLDTYIEISPLDENKFSILKETLTRIGLSSISKDGTKNLIQTAHVFQKAGRWFIVHFKQMYLLDGKKHTTDFTDIDESRTYKIAGLLQSWGLITVIYPDKETFDKICENAKNIKLTVIHANQKKEWNLVPKYTIGTRRFRILKNSTNKE